jgi:hypothetical protein
MNKVALFCRADSTAHFHLVVNYFIESSSRQKRSEREREREREYVCEREKFWDRVKERGKK